MEAIDNGLPLQPEQAVGANARIHMGVLHIHPFWDGNGRIARLVANVPLLKSGLPPLSRKNPATQIQPRDTQQGE